MESKEIMIMEIECKGIWLMTWGEEKVEIEQKEMIHLAFYDLIIFSWITMNKV